MTPWQRRLRAAIAVFGLGFAALVFFALRQPKPPVTPSQTVARLDPNAAVEGTAGQILRLRGSREDVVIDYAQLLTYADGREKLTGVTIMLKKRQGRDITITADEAEVVGPDQSHVKLTGQVVVVDTEGLRLEAPEATYNKSEATVRSDGRVAFSRGRLSGTALGLSYQEQQNLLYLHKEAVLHFAGAQPGEQPLDVNAGSAMFPRLEHNIRFEDGFRAVHGARILESDAATAFLTDDESRMQILEMRGQSRINGLGDGAGALRAMTAQDMNLEFAEDGRTLSRATLSRDAVIEVAAGAGGGRRISGNAINLALEPDGATLTSLTAREQARLDLPKEGEEPARTITAANLIAAGEPGKGLTSAAFSGNCEYREQRAAAKGLPAATRVARSRTLDLAVTPGFGAIDDARFAGAVRFEEDEVRAFGGTARYQVKAGVLELEGIDDSTGRMPRVSDEQVTIDGQTIQLTMEGRRIVARTDVRSLMLAVQGPGSPEKDQAKRASMLKADQAVFATADSLNYDGSARLAVYEGSGRLWQGDTAIQGDRLTVDDATGNLTAHGHVRSTFMLEQHDEKTKKTSRVTTIGSAEDLLYDEALRRATYTTGARVSGPQGDLRATRIELYLKPSGNELERVEGYEQVNLRADERVATGNRLTYFAVDEKYLMVGTPVSIVAECRETVGRTLTFFRAVDTISVDGDDEIRTQTKGGPACAGSRK